ncbi:MAG TPA: hypothetical protein VG294_14500 [Solirubrobacteraceae bacterium]|jgi:hypothetical protein|nr:hypothetical protein [Solirubrobacteraceae bacterium]
MTNRLKLRLIAAAVTAIAVPVVATGPALAAQQVRGVFHIGSGSYIRMGLPNGGYFSNPYSKSSDKTYTPISSGVGGGIRAGVAQNAPSPAFDRHGNSLANSIITPTSFTGIRFGVITTVPPTFYLSGNRLSGHLRNLYAEWNKQTFRQGGIVSGTYNSATHQYTLTWQTKVHGGPFDGYTGHWHLQGTVSP